MYPFLLAIVAAKGEKSFETVSLSGTSGSPRVVSFVATGGEDAVVTWLFGGADGAPASIAKGEVQKAAHIDGDQAIYVSIDTGSDWVIPHDFQNGPYWFRGTLESGDAPNVGLALNVWTQVSNGGSNFFFGWRASGPVETRAGTIKVEIADDNMGTTVFATGYYRGVATNDA